MQRVLIARAVMIAEQKIQTHARRKLGRAAESAFAGIEAAADRAICVIQKGGIDGFAGAFPERLFGKLLAEAFCVLQDLFFARSVSSRNRFEDSRKTGTAVSILGRKIRSAEDRFSRRQQKNGHRPAAASGHHLNRSHVNLVEIRPFFTIDFDVYKVVVHESGD
jgi:hypothetical protein